MPVENSPERDPDPTQDFSGDAGESPLRDSNARASSKEPSLTSAKPVGIGNSKEFGDYRLDQEIARGGMGVVYRATQRKLDRSVALKVILAGELASEQDVRRFYAEAEAAAKLDHPNIVPIYEVGKQGETHYFSMKLIEGSDLRRSMNEVRARPREAIEILEKVGRAVAHAHQRGVLHRDLKPANILLDENWEPFVTDLGLARSTDGEGQLTRTGAVLGTPSYMSPEQASGQSDLTVASDVYSLGAILYEILTGEPPFKGATPMETIMSVLNDAPQRPSINSTSDRSLDLVALKCLEKDPALRYTSAGALADDLGRWLRGEPLAVRTPSLALVARTWMRQNFGNAIWILVVGVLGGLISGYALWNATIQREIALNTQFVYSQLPSADAPSYLFDWVTPKWMTVPLMLLSVASLSLLGFFTALLVKTKNSSADIVSGLAVGVISAVAAFFTAFATLSIVVSMSLADLNLLGLLGSAPPGETPLMVLDAYPEMEQLTRDEQISLLKTKLDVDRAQAIPRGLGLGLVACFILFVGAGVAETFIAGRILRKNSSLLRSLGEYLFSAFPYVVVTAFFGMHLAAAMIFGNFGIVLDLLTLGATACLAAGALGQYFKLRLPLRIVTFSLAVLGLGIFLVYDFTLVPALARGRSKIEETQSKAEQFPDNPRVLYDAAAAYQTVGVDLYDGNRLNSAIDFFDASIHYLESLHPEVMDERLSEQLGSAYGNKAVVFSNLGKPSAAEETFRVASDKHRKNAGVQERLVTRMLDLDLNPLVKRLFDDYQVTDPSELRVLKSIAFAEGWYQRDSPGSFDPNRHRETLDAVVIRLQEKIRTSELPDELLQRVGSRESLVTRWTVHSPPAPSTQTDFDALQTRLLQPSGETARKTSTVESRPAKSSIDPSAKHLEFESIDQQFVDLNRLFPEAGNRTVAFAVGRIQSPTRQIVNFVIGSDDGFELWLNGNSVSSHEPSRPFVRRDDLFPAQLEQGLNEVLIRINQNQGTWGFSFQVESVEGWPADIRWE